MKAYNGFPPEQREKAQRWLNAEWRSGRLAQPSVCCACGQDKGIIDAHAEDYSEPFAAGKTDEFHLCFICHMLLHCRFRSRDAWTRYRNVIRNGGRFAPTYIRDFGTFAQNFLNGNSFFAGNPNTSVTAGDPPTRLVLDEIESRHSTKVAHRPNPPDLPEAPREQGNLFGD